MILLLCALSVYTVTLIVSSYDGPFDVFARLRAKFDKPFSCFVCLSFWVALPSLFVLGFNPLVYLSVVGAAILIWKVSE